MKNTKRKAQVRVQVRYLVLVTGTSISVRIVNQNISGSLSLQTVQSLSSVLVGPLRSVL